MFILLLQGTGWWKHEFCYGKLVQQYHDSTDTGRATILLGVFDAVRHIAWLEKNPNKRPKAASLRKQVSHFYDGGSHCEITGGDGRSTRSSLNNH